MQFVSYLLASDIVGILRTKWITTIKKVNIKHYYAACKFETWFCLVQVDLKLKLMVLIFETAKFQGHEH